MAIYVMTFTYLFSLFLFVLFFSSLLRQSWKSLYCAHKIEIFFTGIFAFILYKYNEVNEQVKSKIKKKFSKIKIVTVAK